MLRHMFLKYFSSARISTYSRQWLSRVYTTDVHAVTRHEPRRLHRVMRIVEYLGGWLDGRHEIVGPSYDDHRIPVVCVNGVLWPRCWAAGRNCRARRMWRTGVTQRPGYCSDQTRSSQAWAASKVRARYKPVARRACEPRAWRTRYLYRFLDEQVVSADVSR